MKAFLTWVSSLDAPAWSPISFLGPCWLQSLHLLGWVLSGHAQQFSTVQSTYAEHGSPVLLDALVVEHGLEGSLWKIHLELSFTREIWRKWQLRKRSCQNLPCRLCSEGHSLQNNVWPKPVIPGPSIATSFPRSSGGWTNIFFTLQMPSYACSWFPFNGRQEQRETDPPVPPAWRVI